MRSLGRKGWRWWRWLRNIYEKKGNYLGWTVFVQEFMNQWGSSPTINHHGQLAKLKQEGKVQNYIDDFRQLQTMVDGWSEEALLGTFIDGLKPWLSKEPKLKQPTRLQDAVRMAKILDQSGFNDQRPAKENSNRKKAKPWPSKSQPAAASISKQQPPEVKKLNREELQDSEDEAEDDAAATSDSSTTDDDPIEANSISPIPKDAELSLHALTGIQSPSTMRMTAWIGKHEVSLRVDNGSFHNFMNLGALQRIGLKGATTELFEVKVASGERLKCQEVVKVIQLNIQGLDVVLGNAWLRGIGKVVTDYNAMTMVFRHEGRKRLWTTLNHKEVQPCEANMIERLCRGGALCFIVMLSNQGGDAEGPQPQPKDELQGLLPQVQRLLEAHRGILEMPTALPPRRAFDHPILLKEESKPINVPPYRYAHFQKGEIERQVEDMLKQGIIRPSTSPFSSPVLLVRKKDGSWRFCTDYRALNEATIKDRFPIPTVDEMLDELHGAKFFTRLDLRAGYQQIRMRDEDVQKTVFRTHSGHYE
ncbi:uncharacterized protein LOC103698684 [Phoenix dactylifera]|uniref:Uncharacterized protein LOC103698684 n=1 Tax=Phoenix dactylifera TaxID=42345 RepID=A0A8B7BKA1_PHODC|nr:uncharacterized protein LOC103698684 [Phoenix dactylifera]